MTPLKAKQAALRELWVERSASAYVGIHEDVAIAFNAAYQTLWSSPVCRFFTMEPGSQEITSGVADYDLTAEIQKIAPPVTLRGLPLVEVKQQAHFDRPALLGLSLPSTGSPCIYLLDTQRSAVADLVGIVLRLKPRPNFSDTLAFQKILHPPRFTACELEVDEGDMPAPHEYFESCVLPLARWYLTRCHWFKNDKLLPLLRADYREALKKLELIDPSTDTRNPPAKAETPGETQQPAAQQ